MGTEASVGLTVIDTHMHAKTAKLHANVEHRGLCLTLRYGMLFSRRSQRTKQSVEESVPFVAKKAC